MKINSKELFKYVNELKCNEKVNFKVYHHDTYITEIYWDGMNFNWQPGAFTSGAFFNSMYYFEPIRELEELTYENTFQGNSDMEVQEILANKINDIIREIKKIKNK